MRSKSKRYAETKSYVSGLYHAEIWKRMEQLLSDGSNTQTDDELTRSIHEMGVPCSVVIVQRIRKSHGIGNVWQRINALKEAAHKMVSTQPIEMS